MNIDCHKEDAREAKALYTMLNVVGTSESNWLPSDLSDMLRQQLEVPLAIDLVPVVDHAEATISTLNHQISSPPANFGEALLSPSPSVEMLNLIKDFAKSLQADPANQIPVELLKVIYFASIIAARVHAGVAITRLTDTELANGCSWCLRRSWLTDPLQNLFEEGARRLSSTG